MLIILRHQHMISEVNHIFEADINGNNISNGKVYDDSDETGTFTGSRN